MGQGIANDKNLQPHRLACPDSPDLFLLSATCEIADYFFQNHSKIRDVGPDNDSCNMLVVSESQTGLVTGIIIAEKQIAVPVLVMKGVSEFFNFISQVKIFGEEEFRIVEKDYGAAYESDFFRS